MAAVAGVEVRVNYDGAERKGPVGGRLGISFVGHWSD